MARKPPRPALRFSHYSDCVYAAIAGDGVALGWRMLLERPLEDGRLKRLCDVSARPEERFHVVIGSGGGRDAPLDRFVVWLRAEFDGGRRPDEA